jgi:hypothetical protein
MQLHSAEVEDLDAVYPVTVDSFMTGYAKRTASDAVAHAFFGWSVAISGETIVVGAHQDDDTARGSGSAYVFVRSGSTWMEQTKLTASDGAARDYFGYSVAISGETIVVGAYQYDGSGAAYVFVRHGTRWIQQAKLTADDGAGADLFGSSVAIHGETVVVGASGDDYYKGAAYVFVRRGGHWFQKAKLTAQGGAPPDQFGFSVAISGETIVVGANQADGSKGSVCVFARDGGSWTQQTKLNANDGEEGDRFGNSVAIRDETIVVGAYADADHGSNSGAAYVFVGSGRHWFQQSKLMAQDGAANDQFGTSVAISGETIVVGAWGDDGAKGSAYLFERRGNRWTEQQLKLTASDGATNDRFGYAVAISGETVVVGASQDEDLGQDSGSVYIFSSVRAGSS